MITLVVMIGIALVQGNMYMLAAILTAFALDVYLLTAFTPDEEE